MAGKQISLNSQELASISYKKHEQPLDVFGGI